jgi:hypothetical protein
MKKAIKWAVIYLVLQMVCGTVAALVALIPRMGELLKNDATLSPEAIGQIVATEMVTPMAIATIVSGVLMAWLLIHNGHVQFNRQTFSEVPRRLILQSVPFILGAMFTCNLLTELCDIPNIAGDLFYQMSHSPWGLLAMVVVAPIVEELIFRGAMEGHMLRQGKKHWVAIVVSAAIFGIIHFNPAQSLFAFLLGLAFGWLYYRTGSVVPGMMGHMLNNAICAVLLTSSTPEEADLTFVEQFGKSAFFTCLALAILALGYGYHLVKMNTLKESDEKGILETQI